jgi:hypothetical protein
LKLSLQQDDPGKTGFASLPLADARARSAASPILLSSATPNFTIKTHKRRMASARSGRIA